MTDASSSRPDDATVKTILLGYHQVDRKTEASRLGNIYGQVACSCPISSILCDIHNI